MVLVSGFIGWLLALAAMVIVLLIFGSTIGFISRSDAHWLADSVPTKLQPLLALAVGHRKIRQK